MALTSLREDGQTGSSGYTLAPAPVSVHYPGVWLSERVWATHGHYLDHHLRPESPVGFPRGRPRRLPAGAALPAHYEHGRIRSHHSRDALPTRLARRPLSTLGQVMGTQGMPSSRSTSSRMSSGSRTSSSAVSRFGSI